MLGTGEGGAGGGPELYQGGPAGGAGRACAGCWYPEEPLESNVDMMGG